MRTILLFAMLFGVCSVALGQEKDAAKNYLDSLSTKFKADSANLFKENRVLETIKAKIVSSNTGSAKVVDTLSTQLAKTKDLQSKLDAIYTTAQNAISHYDTKGVLKKEESKAIFPHEHQIATASAPKSEPPKTYFYFGEKKIIEENNEIFKNKVVNDVFSEILSKDSKTYLGDFSIPQQGQEIILYKDATSKKVDSKQRLNFQKVRFHLLEGSVYDIQIYLTDDKNDSYLFENKVPISLLRYTTRSPHNFMFFKMAMSNDKNTAINTEAYKDLRVKLSDVLTYIPNPGDNYVPEDLTLELPTKTEENTNQAATYKVQQNTALQNVVELRTYTDFLGLFGDAPNGIVQLEGKADFYINPFNYRLAYFFKKITPYVNFSKLDVKTRNVALVEAVPSSFNFKTPLQIIEKSYLQMGLNLNLFSFKFTKEFPFEIGFYGAAQYQITDVMKTDSVALNYKSMGLGGGLSLEFKRYNNFGFIYSAQLSRYNINGFNNINQVLNPGNFWVFKNEAEVYYFPGATKMQSIFLRLKTFNDATKGINDAFYQLQFGYRFSIGTSKLKQ